MRPILLGRHETQDLFLGRAADGFTESTLSQCPERGMGRSARRRPQARGRQTRQALAVATYWRSPATLRSIHVLQYRPFIINPRRACAARVIVVLVCVYVCMYVCMYVCVRSNLPPHTLESQKRDTNRFIAIQEPF